ncbi:hypothetical protein Tco_0932662 [Tanacetum coccineum]
MDNPNIAMKEYIRLQEEKALSRGETFDWQTATYGKMEYCEDENDSFTNIETEYLAIVFDDTSDAALLCKSTVSPLNNNKIDFKMSFDDFDDEDYMVIFEENSFSYKIIYVDNLKTDSENENDKVNMPSSPITEPTIGYIGGLDFFLDFENKFPAIAYNDDLKSKSDPLIEPSVNMAPLPSRDQRHLWLRCLAAHFGLVSDQGLRGLSVVTSELPLIDLHKLGRLNICLRVGDTWDWVALGPERLEEEVHELRRSIVGLREMLLDRSLIKAGLLPGCYPARDAPDVGLAMPAP